jgi:hypothetical protein
LAVLGHGIVKGIDMGRLPEEYHFLGISVYILFIISPFFGVLAFHVQSEVFTSIRRPPGMNCSYPIRLASWLGFSPEILAKLAPNTVNVSSNVPVLNLKTKVDNMALLELTHPSGSHN